jgi:intein/homing endonuclease
MKKIIHLDEYFATGEATVQPVLLWANNRACYENITKHASVGNEYFKTIQPVPGHSFVYVLAVSDWEHYAENRNGDGFPNAPYKPMANPPWISQYETLSNWHHTFESGNNFRHHCFTGETPILMGDRTRKPIEDVVAGDTVMTLEGAKKVVDVMKREYAGDGLSIRLHGNYTRIDCTTDHPVLVYRRDQVHCLHGYLRLGGIVCKKVSCRDLTTDIGEPKWIPASEIMVGDYAVFPKPELGTKKVPEAFARLIGWVASDGCLGKHGAIQFTFSSENTFKIDAVTQCLKDNGLDTGMYPSKLYERVLLSITKKEVADELAKYVTGKKAEKRLTPEVFKLDAESVLHVLGAFCDGDGHVARTNRNLGQLRIRSASESMLYVLHDLIRALGIPATVQWDGFAHDFESPLEGYGTYHSEGSGVVAVSKGYAAEVLVNSDRHKNLPEPGRKNTIRISGSHFLVPVTDVEEITLDTEVFNLEVEDVHHYVANGIVVHNCNKDPEKRVGKVVKSFWNDTMHRVELLIDLDNEKAPDLAARIAAGEFPPVSMGTKVAWDVCLLPETLVRTSTGHKAIKDIEIGETVRTHTGALKRVTAHYIHETDEDLYTVTVGGIAHPITATGKHPFLILKKEDVRTCQGSANGERPKHMLQKGAEPVCSRCNRTVELNPEWTPAEDIRVGDYALIPVDTCNPKDTVGAALATVFGFYLGNGSVIWSERHETAYDTSTPRIKFPSGVQFSMNLTQEDCIKHLCDALDELALPNGWHRYDRPDKTEAAIHVLGPEFAAAILELGGAGSQEKKIHESVFSWSVNEKLSVLGGYLDTDGSVDATKGVGRILSANPALLIDTQRLGLSAGLHVAVGNAGHPISFDGTTRIPCYHAFVTAHDLQQLKSHSAKASWTQKIPQYGSPKSFFWNSYWCTPVKKIESSSDATNVVHNLAVEGDESYLAEGICSHNCTICGNRAPTRAQYCDHLRFQMRGVINGVKVAALNPSPKFFDISWVVRPADPTAYMMKKVANGVPYELISGVKAGEYLDLMDERKLAAHKIAVIDKVVQGIPLDAKTENVDPTELGNIQRMRSQVLDMGGNVPTIPDETLHQLSSFPLEKTLSSAFSGGMLLKTPELTKLVFFKSYPKHHPEKSWIDRSVGLQGPIMELISEHPQILDSFENADVFNVNKDSVDPKILEVLSPYFEKTSGMGDYLKRNIVPEKYRDEGEFTTPLTITDPATGQQYRTTRGAAIRAHDEVAKRNLYKTVGGAALLGGTYKVLGSGLSSKGLGALKPLVGGTLAAAGLSHLPSMGNHYMTDQGVPISTVTELSKTSSLALPLFGTLGLMTLLSSDYKSRMARGEPVGHPGLPLGRRLLDQAGEFTNEHPIASAAVGMAGLHTLGNSLAGRAANKQIIEPGAKYLRQGSEAAGNWLKRMADGTTKLSAMLDDLLPQPTDTVMLPSLDIEKIAERIGELIVEG